MARLGRFCARHGWWVLAVWIALLVAATLGHRATGGDYSDDFQLPASSAQQGADLLRAHEPKAGGLSGQLVFTARGTTLRPYSSQLATAAGNVARLPHVLFVGDPLAAATTSKDGRTAYATVRFDVNPKTLGPSYVASVDQAVTGARAAGVNVDYGGVLGQAARPKANEALSEVIGVGVAIVVLLVGFGSVYAAGLPILTALVGVGTGIGVLGIVASTTTFASVAPTLGIMIGLGVGIDYALFLATRHRQLVMDGVEPAEAAARAVSTSGQSVLVAAATVVIAMLGLFASGIGFIGKLGLAAAITVAVSALAATTLVPALLGLAGRRIDRLRVRRPVAEGGADGDLGDTGWHRYAARVSRHPWRFLGAGVAVLAILAFPMLSMTLGHVDAGANPTSYTDRRAYDAISNGFGPGANRPFTVVVQLADGASRPALASGLDRALAGTPGVAAATPARTTTDGSLLVATVVPTTRPQDAATDQLLARLNDQTLPDVLAGTGSHGYITGNLAASLDFRDQVSARLPVIIAVVIAAAFLLLLASFRSPFLALKAAVLNLFSIGAAYGVVVAVFQWGWGGSLLGVGEKVPVESYVPMMMFAIVFGLSMDYEVFLLSRVRERWLATGDNGRSVADGLAATARVITCAALIMTSVFLAFLLSSNVVIKMLALGLGVSVLIDASLIRLLVVPATMFLLGHANWWLPRWLDRLLPRLEPEPEPQPAPEPEPQPRAELGVGAGRAAGSVPAAT
ncbi:MMPL family transporter [Pseudofrankia sp. BMG5.37]|uniref:MMPL family transporter n=1 Tax=Pseudofrankia sp. BMG5.37 TaxID=3050035 RepID=UPI002893D80B|nr:MMPL family transporter [Pseudofrankia sp. BMG5.37]MDT3440600.1 MMPL family transporter [Pseudofrankia sp. BMG5.37]